MNNNLFEQYLKTYSGRELLKKYSFDTEGTWEIRGEDPNCDFGGHHHSPFLGVITGKLEDVIYYAVNLRGFWQWGAGGEITLLEIKAVPKMPESFKSQLTQKDKEREEKLALKKKLQQEIEKLQREIDAI